MDRVEQLTEAQRECLRLVLTHHSSKEIAIIVGVSPSAVDKRIERAVQFLGASSRFAAARMVNDHERNATWERLPSDQIDLPPEAGVAAPNRQIEPSGIDRGLFGLPIIRENGRARNRLTKLQRLMVILGGMVLLAVGAMAVLNMATTLDGIFRREGIGLTLDK